MHPTVYVENLTLTRPAETFNASLCISHFPTFENCEEFGDLFHPEEQAYYQTLQFEKRIHSYLIGRLTGKKAIASLMGNENLAQIIIRPGIFRQPIVTCENQQNIQVSISHCDNWGAAIAFPEAHPMGIDIERINSEQNEALEREASEFERRLIQRLPFDYEVMLTLLWTVKEALSKVLKTGLTAPFRIYEIAQIETQSDSLLSFYKNFAQYKALSFMLGHYICTIAYPLKTELTVDLHSLKETFRTLVEL
ncbi:MAG TPA: 4'-phosphopantetheinyl transferase [Firmicutes bacterium]|jgi:4'-phosphopantetheinyl transferase|nr:4'-phosphopantetheinyl transferase [Bacillota bacterium]